MAESKHNGQTGPKRRPFQREMDLEILAKYRAQGWTLAQCAEWIQNNRNYRLSRSQICRDFAECVSRWKAGSLAAIEDHRQRQLAVLDALEREAWAAWEKSKEMAVTKSAEETAGTEGAGVTKHKVRQEQTAGDSTFLKRILEIQERRAKLLGLDAPTKLANADGGILPAVQYQPVLEIHLERLPGDSWEEKVAHVTNVRTAEDQGRVQAVPETDAGP